MAKENNIAVLNLENKKKIIGREKDINIIKKMLKKQKSDNLSDGTFIKENKSQQHIIDEKEAKRIIIKQIINITGEKSKKYKNYTLFEVINILDELKKFEYVIDEISIHDMILVLEKETGYPYD